MLWFGWRCLLTCLWPMFTQVLCLSLLCWLTSYVLCVSLADRLLLWVHGMWQHRISVESGHPTDPWGLYWTTSASARHRMQWVKCACEKWLKLMCVCHLLISSWNFHHHNLTECVWTSTNHRVKLQANNLGAKMILHKIFLCLLRNKAHNWWHVLRPSVSGCLMWSERTGRC